MKKKILFFCLIIVLLIYIPTYADDYGTIILDGYFDDWQDKPHSLLFNGNLDNANEVHEICFFRDEDNGYVHLIISENQNNNFYNAPLQLQIRFDEGKENIRVDFNPAEDGMGDLEVRIESNSEIIGTGYYVFEEGEKDEIELNFPLTALSEELYSIMDMELRIPKLGKQSVISIGVSTGGYILVLGGFAIVLLGLWRLYGRKNIFYKN